jgi:hypothetical protein
MRGILKEKKNKKGQVIIINLLFLVMTIVVFVAMIPVLQEQINLARHQTALNCGSNANVCSTSPGVPCYNSSLPSSNISCALIDLYIPYIVIIVLIAGVAKLMSNRVESFMTPQQQQPMYYQ